MKYDYEACVRDMENLCRSYNFCELFSIGESVMERKLLCLRIGNGEKKLFLNGAHHGLEYLTAKFLNEFADRYCENIVSGGELLGHNCRELFDKTSVYILPMVNPDGVDIAVNGVDITNPHHRRLISMVGIHSFNRVWQANANGVDINHNYNAGWRAVAEKPCASKYSGEFPESEPETQAIVNFVRCEDFDMLIAFHSQGEEIYYDYDGLVAARSEELAVKMAEKSGYQLAHSTGTASFGGCKDWFLKEFSRAGFTVEIGCGKNPLPVEMLDKIFDENAAIVLCALSEL